MKPQSGPPRKPSLALGLLLAGAIWPAAALDPAALVPHGQFANLDTHRLYVDCRGRGTPRVLIDYGIGGAAVEWRAVQTALASDTTVCVYDRAGYGWSDPGPSPRSTAQAAAEMGLMAQALSWSGSLLLVGHSFGGFDVRYFAAQHPGLVAGLVLLDSSLAATGLSGAAPAAHAGTRNPIDARALADEPADEALAVARYLNSRRKAVFTQMDELANFKVSGNQVTAAGPLPDVPLVVVARDPARGVANAEVEAAWQAGQRALADSVPNGERWTAARSGHEIHRDRPDVVVAAVRRVLSLIRAVPPPDSGQP